jgi:hypothetical protein
VDLWGLLTPCGPGCWQTDEIIIEAEAREAREARASSQAIGYGSLEPSWDLPPVSVITYDTQGGDAASAGGIPTVKSTVQYFPPASWVDQVPELAKRKAREETLLAVAPIALAVLTEGISQLSLRSLTTIEKGAAGAASTFRGDVAWGARMKPEAIELVLKPGQTPTLTPTQGSQLGADMGAAGQTLVLGKYPANVRFVSATPVTYSVDRPWGWTWGYNEAVVRGHMAAGGQFLLLPGPITGTYEQEVDLIEMLMGFAP